MSKVREEGIQITNGEPGESDFSLANAWESMCLNKTILKYYEHPLWYEAALTSGIVSADTAIFLIGKNRNDCNAIFPILCHKAKSLSTFLRSTHYHCHPHLILRDAFIKKQGVTKLYGSLFLRALRRIGKFHWDIIEIDSVPLNGGLSRALGATSGRGYIVERAGSSSIIECVKDYDTNIGHLSGSFRRNIRRLEKKARADGEVSLVSCTDKESRSWAIREFIDIENDSWKGQEQSAIAQDPSLVNFYTKLAESDDLGCRINLLKIGDIFVAGHFGFVNGETFYISKIGYRASYSELGPGNLIMALTVRDFSLDGKINRINLVTSPEWAEKWKTDQDPLLIYKFYNSTPKGLLLLAFHKAKCCAKWFIGKIKSNGEH